MTAPFPLLVVLAGCSGPAPCEGDCESGSHAKDSGVAPYEQEDPTPEWSLDDVREQIFMAFGTGLPNPDFLKETYLGMMAMGDDDCVGSDTIITQDYILGCVADSGYYYSGVCVYDESNFSDEFGATSAWGLGGDFELAYPDGNQFAAGGGATWQGFTGTDGNELFEANIRGTWFDESADNWLGQGLSSLVDITGGKTDGQPYVTVDGGVAIGETDLYFEAVTWDWGGTCAGKPVGTIRLRDPRGYWYVWTLDDDCDECGEVLFHQDTSLGELCLDLTPVGEDAYHANAVNE